MSALLEVRQLTVELPIERRSVQVVRGIDFDIGAGETLGLVGESGSGKSITAMAILGLIDVPGSRISADLLRFDGQDLLSLSEKEFRHIRGKQIGAVFQDPLSALNPVMRIGDQIAEAIETHQRGISKQALDKRVLELLRVVGIPDPETRRRAFPGQFSGGMRQRVTTAIAVANNPKLLILDEPTTALDVTIQAQILSMLRRIKDEFGCAALMISHDLGVVSTVADRIAVMYSGRLVEVAPATALFLDQAHHYTRALLEARPSLEGTDSRLVEIPGRQPSPTAIPSGCSFHPRCPRGVHEPKCASVVPALVATDQTRSVACHFPISEHIDRKPDTGVDSFDRIDKIDLRPEPILSVRHLQKSFAGAGHSGRSLVKAVDKVSLDISAGKTLALIGESGCGKSTVARVLTLHLAPTDGTVLYRGADIRNLPAGEARSYRRDVQLVHQDPASSFDPRQRIGDALNEVMTVNGLHAGRRRERSLELMEAVGLDSNSLDKRPYEFSGGQRQRVAIARALAIEPDVLVLDEPVSSLDVSVQAQIINLLSDLQDETGLAYVFIAHDLAVARHVAHYVAVMYLGRLVEIGTAPEVFGNPTHPYTRALISAVPSPTPHTERRKITLKGEIPSAANPPSGCHFRTRCWLSTELCAMETPPLDPIEGDPHHRVACHYSAESALERILGQAPHRGEMEGKEND